MRSLVPAFALLAFTSVAPSPVDAAEITAMREVARIPYGSMVRSVAFSPDGKTLAVTGNGTLVRLIDTATFEETAQLDCGAGNTSYIDAVGQAVFSPDGRTLAVTAPDTTVQLWDTGTHRLVAAVPTGFDDLKEVAFSPDGRRLAAGRVSNIVKVWNVEQREQPELVANLEIHPGICIVEAVAFSPDGSLLAAGTYHDDIKVWSMSDLREVGRFHAHLDDQGGVTSLDLSADGKTLFSGGFDHAGRSWAVPSWTQGRVFALHTHWVNGVRESPDGTYLATAAMDGLVYVYPLSGSASPMTLDAHRGEAVSAVAWSPDGRLFATGGWDDTAVLWRIESQKGTENVCEIETGPIWNQQDAEDKCPKVCEGGAWNGGWRTVRPAEASSCDCTGVSC